MLASLLLLAQAPALGPVIPAGASTTYMAAALAVEDRLHAKDFTGAEKASKLLPKKEIVIQWDDSKVPQAQRGEFAASRDKALDRWKGFTGATITFGTKSPDVKFSFEQVLPTPPDSGLPSGSALFWSEAANEPRLEVVMGLKRGLPPEPIALQNIHNEVAHAMGSYFGLESSPSPSQFMGKTDLNYTEESQPTVMEIALAKNLTGVTQTLRDAIHSKTVLLPTRPKLFIEPKSINLGTVLQGDPEPFQVQIGNNGNAPLAVNFTPDCGCITSARTQVIQPGATFVLDGSYDTMLTTGEIRHRLTVTSNDPENNVVPIPIAVHVKPTYRFLLPKGDIVLLPEEGTSLDAYLVLSEGSDIVPQSFELAGMEGKATFVPWKGKLADPAMNEPEADRAGYKVTIKLDGKMPVPGRAPITLWANTSSKRFPTVQTNFFVQRGIVALPMDLYMGDIGATPRKFSFIVSGPSKSFKVTKVTTDWPHVTFETYPNSEETEYRVIASYDGKAPKGPVTGTVWVETDDPKQPKIRVPIKATVR